MQLLLDTHIWMWSQTGSKHLSGRVARALESSRNERWISPVSIWEILNLTRKGRLRLAGGGQTWIAKSIAEATLREAPLTGEVAMATETFSLPHGDPIDTFLVATARVYGLTLVTADRNLVAAKACAILSNL